MYIYDAAMKYRDEESAAAESSRARNTALVPRATGPPKERFFSACAPSWPKASSASTAATSSAWACCRWSSCPAKHRNRSVSLDWKFSISRVWLRISSRAKKSRSLRRARTGSEELHRAGPRRHAFRGRLLPARRDSAVRSPANALGKRVKSRFSVRHGRRAQSVRRGFRHVLECATWLMMPTAFRIVGV